MIEYLLDSDVLIWQLREQAETAELLARLSKRGILACSVMSIVEIQAGVRRGEEKKTNALLDSLKAYDVTPAIANLAGKFIRDHRAKGITLDFADSIIAATAAVHNLTLLTYNVKHYPMPEVKLYS
ncbi:MAG: type II toxin-antitoxin system VapC family toxin [Anaerolineae bacterium]|nr:type II toxin-antitoxin system VapC family toxin [Anaerolineae bacterium]